jgi:flagellar L-ring protein precursor FlgH
MRTTSWYRSAALAAVVAAAALQPALAGEKRKKGDPVPAPPSPPAAVTYAGNGSLYSNATAGEGLFSDFKPRRVGDLVFVDVIETSAATVSSGANQARKAAGVAGVVGAAGTVPVPGAGLTAAALGDFANRKYDGSGSTERQSRLRARIAARVIEVLPNGDLRIEARKVVKINKEKEQLALSGVVRQRDVSPDNSISTTAVGDLSVELNGKGVASSGNAPGWLYRFFEKISPF